MRILLVVIALLFPYKGALASPSEGGLFGYTLGSKYAITDSTQGRFSIMGAIVVPAENPEKSGDFQRVELITSPKTFTIANIYGIAEVVGEKEAKDLATRYAELLETLHAGKCLPSKAYLDETLKLLCVGRYELSVAHYPPQKKGMKYEVHVGLTFSNESAEGKEILAQMRRELAQLKNEGKLHRLEQARKEQKLLGLQ